MFQNLSSIPKLKNNISEKETEIQHLETQLTPFKTIALEKYTGTEQERLKKLSERIQELENPLKKTIASATAHIEVTIKSEEKISTRYMDRGGYLIFVKNRQPYLATANTQSDANQNGKGEVIYVGDFFTHSECQAIGKPIETLQSSDSIQIMFVKIPPNSQVVTGKAIIVINGDTRFEFEIPPQKMNDDKIFILDIKNKFLTNT